MRPDDLRRLLGRQPFRPFRLWVLETTAYEVRHPELVMLGRSTLTVDVPVPDSALPLARSSVILALIHITKMEPIPAGASGEGT